MDLSYLHKLRDTTAIYLGKLKATDYHNGKTALLILAPLLVIIIIAFVILSSGVFFPTHELAYSDGEQWQYYSNEEIGYSVSLPIDWKVEEEATASGPDILISDTNSLAFLRIRGMFDPYLNSKETIASSIKQYEAALSLQENTTVYAFVPKEFSDEVGGFVVLGEFPIGDALYSFEEHGILITDSRVFIMRAADSSNTFNDSILVMSDIMASFRLN